MDSNSSSEDTPSSDRKCDGSTPTVPRQPCERFVHTQLDYMKEEFRLLKLERPDTDGSATQIPQCTMQIFSIEKAPPYRAVSYVWGELLDMKTILIDGQEMEVSENLFDFLVRQQTSRVEVSQQGEWLWADQICIDQACMLERNHQVARMGEIFSEATQVLVWLGEDSETAHAIEVLASMPDIDDLCKVGKTEHGKPAI